MPRAGFSLVELAIVVLVMGIMVGVAAPKYAEALNHYRVEAAARRIVADLKHARQNAITGSAEQRITFELDTDSYTLDGMDDINRSSDEYTVDLAAEGYPVDLSTTTFPGGAFRWEHDGNAFVSGSMTLASGSASRVVTVSHPCSIVISTP
ncbi:MAG: GspH/FimT family pseudopilin [Planctomycetota bacterium]